MESQSEISRFRGIYGFLSNFYHSPIRYRGLRYATVEHAFQAAKTMNPAQKLRILAASTPGRAKRIGRQVTLRKDWEQVKVRVMLDCLRAKFAPGSLLAAKLEATGDRHLEEGNTWGDKFWGTVRGEGRNQLGRLLMQVRDENRGR